MPELNTTPFAGFEQLVKPLGLSDGKLGQALGYSTGAVRGWRNTGKVPLVAVHAARHLLAQQGAASSENHLLLLRCCNGEFTQLATMRGEPDEIKLGGQRHYLIPVQL
jgi:hypothetical protein